MEKMLEDYLWNNFGLEGNPKQIPFARDVIDNMVEYGMINRPKQAYRTLEKWVNQRKYDYGCCLDLGWKVNDG